MMGIIKVLEMDTRTDSELQLELIRYLMRSLRYSIVDEEFVNSSLTLYYTSSNVDHLLRLLSAHYKRREQKVMSRKIPHTWRCVLNNKKMACA